MMTDMHPIVAAMPRVKLVCRRDWMWGPARHYEIGAYWDADPWPRLGAEIYRRRWLIRIHIDTGRLL